MIGSRVRVHLNLHRGDFSVADPRTGKVIANVQDITLSGVTFRVQPALLAKIRAWNRRKVCAYAVGVVEAVDSGPAPTGRKVTFNPFRSDHFHDAETGEPVHSADLTIFTNHYCYTEG